jgi:prolyl oligopeptidase PreP (S9A serine peptidase family)
MIRYRRYSGINNLPALMEYGDPADAEQFKFIYAYSPYEHVRTGETYPAFFLRPVTPTLASLQRKRAR